MYPKDDSSIVLDTVTDAKSIIPIIAFNKGVACDSFFVKYDIKGNPENKGIVVPTLKGHLGIGGKYSAYIVVVPEILHAGKYEIISTLYSKRHPQGKENIGRKWIEGISKSGARFREF